MSDALILTLGHNSSAVAVRDGHILGGYETERFTLKKSDSAYPKQPIEELIHRHNIDPNADVYVGHWFLDANLPDRSNKYLDYDHLKMALPNHHLCSLNRDFTHHDSHLQSAMVFAGDGFSSDYHAFVVDGFGSYGECISVYRVQNGAPRLQSRWFGFEKSLGMLYQYATAYMGMKQHNHEYKILAYEAQVHDHKMLVAVQAVATTDALNFFKDLIVNKMDERYDPLISVDALPRIQYRISQSLDKVCDELMIDKNDVEGEFRPCISLYVQTFVEVVMQELIGMYRPKDVLLCGGFFYNVKINSMIVDSVPGKVCIMPLAGDQGAGLGVYQHYCGDLKWPEHLFWGHRDLNFAPTHDGIIVVPNDDAAADVISTELDMIGFVNVVRGAMEFGPRALCNTTTLAHPYSDNIAVINRANDRTEVMPCAPVTTPEYAGVLFKGLDRIHKSLEYMIVTREYRDDLGECYDGAAHLYQDGRYTGRPQVTNDPLIADVIGDTTDPYDGRMALVNTSFNVHGVPIVFGRAEIEHSHAVQNRNEPGLQIKTVVVSGGSR